MLLARDVGCGRWTTAAAGVVVAPLVATWSLVGIYPDVLLVAALLLGLRGLAVARGPGAAAASGAVLGVAYLAKAVGLPSALVVLGAVAVARVVAGEPLRRTAVLTGAATAALLAVCLPQLVAVSVEAGRPVLSTSAEFNARLVQPGVAGQPLSFRGLYPADDPDVATPWERPEDLPVPLARDLVLDEVTADDVDAASATGDARVDNAVDQARVAAGVLVRRAWPLALPALLGLVLVARALPAARRRRRPPDDDADPPLTAPSGGPTTADPRTAVVVAVAAALVAVGLAAGQSLLIVVERYLWTTLLALGVLGLVAAAGLRRRDGLAAVAVLAVGVLAAVSSAPAAAARWQDGRDVWRVADARCDGGPGDPDDPRLPGPLAGTVDWERSQLLAWLCGVDYLGLTGEVTPLPEAVGTLDDAGGQVLVVWPDPLPPGADPVDGDARLLGTDGRALRPTDLSAR